jgi:hypothetical protein
MYIKYLKKVIFIIGFSTSLISCNLFTPKADKEAVARVGENFLYKEDITKLLSSNISAEDSAVIVSNYINSWATRQLLYDNALINLPDEKMKNLESLVNEYKFDLYAKAYKEAVVKTFIDTIVRPYELLTFYESNMDNFKLNEQLIKLRYIYLSNDNHDTDLIEGLFKSFTQEDQQKLDSLSLQFNAYSLNDSIWVKSAHVYNKIPLLKEEKNQKYLKKSQFLKLEDSLGVYLVRINDRLDRNDTAPLEYVKPTIRQIILNKRTLEFIRKFEKDVLTDATKNNSFEVY